MGIPERLGPPLAIPSYGEREIGPELVQSSYGDALFVMTGELVPYMDVIPLSVGHFQWTQVVDDPYAYLHKDADPATVCALYIPAGSTTLVTNREDDEQNMILRGIKPRRNPVGGSDRHYFGSLKIICGQDVYVRSNSRDEPYYYVPGGSLTDQVAFERERQERQLPYGITADCIFKTPDTRYDFVDLRGLALPEPYRTES